MFYNQKTYGSFYSTLALLLTAVLLFNVFGSNLHECSKHSNVNAEVSCNDENELDACHRFLIHHEKSQACNGSHEHLNASHDECFVCKYVKERQNEAIPAESGMFAFVQTDITFNSSFSYLSELSVSAFQPRGPPLS
jgi:hypothetical protein